MINDVLGKDYPLDVKVNVLPSEGYLTENESADGSKEIEEQISDFLIKIKDEVYLLECQSYDDGSMAVRIAEYAFIAARQSAVWDYSIPMPVSAVYEKDIVLNDNIEQAGFIWTDVSLLLRSDTK